MLFIAQHKIVKDQVEAGLALGTMSEGHLCAKFATLMRICSTERQRFHTKGSWITVVPVVGVRV